MDVNSVMSTYSLNSFWNSYTSSNSSVPLTNNVSSTVEEKYTGLKYAGATTASELSDIYKTVEPSYGMSVTYDAKGNMTGKVSTDSSVAALLSDQSSTADNAMSNILKDYNSIESGAYQASISSPSTASILASSSSSLYTAVDALLSNATTSNGSIVDALV